MINLFKSCHHVTIKMEEVCFECSRVPPLFRGMGSSTRGKIILSERAYKNIRSLCSSSPQRQSYSWAFSKEVFQDFLLFLRHGGSITCQVTGHWRYSQDLAQGGIRIPCELILRELNKKGYQKI